MTRVVIDVVSGAVEVVALTEQEIAASVSASAAEALQVPEAISRSQFWQQVEADGITASANALIDGLPDPVQKIRAREVTNYVRSDSQLIQMATALGMDSAEIDQFFRDASAR